MIIGIPIIPEKHYWDPNDSKKIIVGIPMMAKSIIGIPIIPKKHYWDPNDTVKTSLGPR